MRDQEKTIGNIIDKSKGSFVSYIDEEGFPITKAMLSPREREGIKVIYLTTNTSSNKVKDYRKNTKASLYFVDQRFFRGVSLLGHMEIMEDENTKQRIWREGDTMYYPQGVNDPDYCVLKFTAHKGRYYSNFKNEDFIIE